MLGPTCNVRCRNGIGKRNVDNLVHRDGAVQAGVAEERGNAKLRLAAVTPASNSTIVKQCTREVCSTRDADGRDGVGECNELDSSHSGSVQAGTGSIAESVFAFDAAAPASHATIGKDGACMVGANGHTCGRIRC